MLINQNQKQKRKIDYENNYFNFKQENLKNKII